MATFGSIRFRIAKAFPGIDPDLIDGWINDRYTQILDRLKWSRQRRTTVIAAVAPYQTGTVAVTAGSNAVTLTGGTFTAAMTGRRFRVDGDDAYYTFTRTTDTTGTLDRTYSGESNTLATFTIWRGVYTLPSDARLAVDVRGLDRALDLDKKTLGELNELAPSREAIGTPALWCPALDDRSDPPLASFEVYPAPDAAMALEVDYEGDEAEFGPDDTAVSLKPWARPGCLIAGVTADARDYLKEYTGADRAERRFGELFEQMANEDARRDGPKALKMASAWTDHRLLRQVRGVRNPRRLP